MKQHALVQKKKGSDLLIPVSRHITSIPVFQTNNIITSLIEIQYPMSSA